MNYCNDCKEIFDLPTEKSHTESHGERITEYRCPECGSRDIEKAGRCELCNEPVSMMQDYCESCKALLDEGLAEIENYLRTDRKKLLKAISEIYKEEL